MTYKQLVFLFREFTFVIVGVLFTCVYSAEYISMSRKNKSSALRHTELSQVQLHLFVGEKLYPKPLGRRLKIHY